LVIQGVNRVLLSNMFSMCVIFITIALVRIGHSSEQIDSRHHSTIVNVLWFLTPVDDSLDLFALLDLF